MVGITRGTTAGHVARAALESIAYPGRRPARRDGARRGIQLAELRVDGGASANDVLMQFQADLLGVPVVRPAGHRDDGARRGLSGRPRGRLLGIGRRDRRRQWQVDRRFEPRDAERRRRAAAGAMARGASADRRAGSGGARGLTDGLEPGRHARAVSNSTRARGTSSIIGGGATGVGIAVDAASRGYSVLLLEQSDFGKGTSSRSTKLVHGGVRYLEQGNISLVMEALKERGILRQNAPHLVSNLPFVVPNYDWWETPFYGIGLKVYNLLAGKYGFGDSSILSREETLRRLPTIRTDGLRGGVVYYDGQFDDSRLLINLVQTAAEQGATLLNYAPVTALTKAADGSSTA